MGSYRARDYGCLIALLALSMIPMMVFYLYCQRHIIEGVVPGAVKGQKRK
ncbi:MAG: carbohydrate ABC transporter permease, partial [Lachnospiraceae bacterium]|nr:carbohydrate ABC transporter permease [Lachnospiraceae bacterium]